MSNVIKLLFKSIKNANLRDKRVDGTWYDVIDQATDKTIPNPERIELCLDGHITDAASIKKLAKLSTDTLMKIDKSICKVHGYQSRLAMPDSVEPSTLWTATEVNGSHIRHKTWPKDDTEVTYVTFVSSLPKPPKPPVEVAI